LLYKWRHVEGGLLHYLNNDHVVISRTHALWRVFVLSLANHWCPIAVCTEHLDSAECVKSISRGRWLSICSYSQNCFWKHWAPSREGRITYWWPGAIWDHFLSLWDRYRSTEGRILNIRMASNSHIHHSDITRQGLSLDLHVLIGINHATVHIRVFILYWTPTRSTFTTVPPFPWDFWIRRISLQCCSVIS
jgi:hypothetical protein